MCVKLTINVSILSLRWLSDPVKNWQLQSIWKLWGITLWSPPCAIEATRSVFCNSLVIMSLATEIHSRYYHRLGLYKAHLLQGSPQSTLALRLSTKLTLSKSLFYACSEALNKAHLLQGSFRGLLWGSLRGPLALRLSMRIAQRLPTRLARSEAFYRLARSRAVYEASSLWGSLRVPLAP